ncbi:MAG: ABC transporter substrate-binding protein, partial [Actinobacteria bacterium]|nr:ABC transporter substrate-binding protein [Actinomycetota bacterium]
MTIRRTLCAAAALLLATAAHAEIVVGVSLSTTGPSASLGITQKNSLAFYPDTIGGEKLRLVVVDDASDPSTGTRLARKLVTEDHVDII